MRIRGHGNAVAIALAGLAVAIAATGTAVAVTATQVNIADPTTPSRIAHVDSSGRLSTVGVGATVNPEYFVFSDSSFSPTALTSPTTATLGLTSVFYDNAYNRTLPNTDFDAILVRITVGAGGTCYDSDRTVATVRRDSLPAGGDASANFGVPMVFKATGGKAYCIGLDLSEVDSSPGSEYAASVGISAVILGGSYTGAGTAVPNGLRALPGARPPLRKR